MKYLIMTRNYDEVVCDGVFDTLQDARLFIEAWDRDLAKVGEKSGAWIVEAPYNPVYNK